MQKKLKKVIFTVAVISAVVVIATYCIPENKEKSHSTSNQLVTAVAVELARAEMLPATLSSIGELEATRQVMVTSEVSGLIVSIQFQPGERVRAGQMLVQLNDAPEQGQLIKLKSESVNALAQLTRIRGLIRKQAATQEELDQAQANWQKLQGEIASMQATIEQKRIKAPFDGVLGVRKVNKGQFIQAGYPMVSLTDASKLYANMTFPESTIPEVKTGLTVSIITDAHPEHEFNGEVSTIEPVVDRGTRTVLIQATIMNPNNLLSSGMYVKGKITLSNQKNIVTVLETAVSYNAYGDFVYVIDTNDEGVQIARQVYIKAGKRNGNRVEIVSGITAKDRVITSGQLRISNGSPVKIIPSDALAVENTSPKSDTQ